jgi:transposase
MLSVDGFPRVLLYRDPVDMRKSIDGLSFLVIDGMARSPGDGTLFVFCNRQRDKVKMLYWDRNGFCLWYKRLEKERFKIPAIEGASCTLSASCLRWLMDGLDISKTQGFKPLHYQQFC